MSILPHARLHHDVLMGEDEILKPGDIFMGMFIDVYVFLLHTY